MAQRGSLLHMSRLKPSETVLGFWLLLYRGTVQLGSSVRSVQPLRPCTSQITAGQVTPVLRGSWQLHARWTPKQSVTAGKTGWSGPHQRALVLILARDCPSHPWTTGDTQREQQQGTILAVVLQTACT